MSRALTFDDLRAANLARLPRFRNRRDELVHTRSDGSDWCLAQWSNATLGELGEAANVIKKIERGDLTLEAARQALADELADTAIYLDLLAFQAGIRLDDAIVAKFNRTSERIGCAVRLEPAA